MVFSPKLLSSTLNLLQGASQPCNYQVIITPPAAMLGVSGILGPIGTALGIAGAANISILAEKASLPGRQIATTPFRMYGTVQKMPYGAVYSDVTISFICSNAMTERLFFDTWQALIMNPKRQYMHYYDTYVGTVSVLKLANSEESSAISAAAANYHLLEAYPVSVTSQELSYSSTETYLSLDVGFAYRRWTTLAEEIFTTVAGASPGFSGAGDNHTGDETQQIPDIVGSITDFLK